MINSQTVSRRIVCCTMCLLVVLLLALPAGALSWNGQSVPGQILAAKIHMQPSMDSAVLGLMEDGTVLKVLKKSGDFYLVDCYEMTGYIPRYQVRYREDVGYYVNCNAFSDETVTVPQLSFIPATELRNSIAELARTQLGTPYVYGGARPGGFDCSGFTSYIYARNGIMLHRTASQQLQDGLIVAKDALQVGDLVFFRVAGETTAASHVGIYVGEGRIIHAASTGIRFSDLENSYYTENYLCARRIVNVSIQELVEIIDIDTDALSRALSVVRGKQTE